MSDLKAPFNQDFTLGVLGGGQLGRMLIQSGIDFNLRFRVLDPDPAAPCSSLSDFVCGPLTDYSTVMEFGRTCDLITIEIENVNTQALRDLAALGKRVYPQPDIIEMIQDKRRQKEFYQEHNIPTAPFVLVEGRADVLSKARLPVVNKLGREGYDGRGVQILRSPTDLDKAFDKPGLLEELIPFDREISILVARNASGSVKTYPAVEMEFHPEQNLVEFLFAPSTLSPEILSQADMIATSLVDKLGLVGLLAIEMFVTPFGQVLVNEIAPRPHNSGHQTIEANSTSQYEQHLRAVLNLPLGDTQLLIPGAMVNLLGEPGYSGPAEYVGFAEVISIPGVHVHLYGKKITKPFRKMGHVTIVDKNIDTLKQKAVLVKNTLKVISRSNG
jgi:5-(carboxyamino)imidazole ribonucleotide synthase